MGMIELDQAEKWFNDVQVIKGINLRIENGEFVVIVGPSGCGKSTLLRMIGGLEETSKGNIFIDSVNVTSQPPSKRGLSMVFQSYALYPHLSVEDNMGFPLKTAGASKSYIKEHVQRVAKILKLEELLKRLPKTLSGGQRQRVAIGRSIVRNPTAFLFDEPLSNLDAALRIDMRLEISKIHRDLKSTMVYVTHDQVEAMTLADRIVVLDSGSVSQIGAPKELYENPGNIFVAKFIGSPQMNIIPFKNFKRQFMRLKKGETLLAQFPAAKQVGIRPEHIKIDKPGKGHFEAFVDVIEYLGADTFIVANTDECGEIRARAGTSENYEEKMKVSLKFEFSKLHFFDDNGIKLT